MSDEHSRAPGIKTSVYLPATVAAEWKASGASITELVRSGLAARAEPLEDVIRRVLRDELTAALAAVKASTGGNGKPVPECKHPGTGRKQRCKACGAYNV